MIHFWKLPSNRIHVLLKQEYNTSFVRSFLNETKTTSNAARLIGYSRPTINNLKNKDAKIKIDLILKISEFINDNKFSLPEIEKNIIWIGHPLSKGIKNPKLPFNFATRSGARFIAAIMNDGCITSPSKRSYGELMYDNFDKGLRDSVKRDAVSVVGGKAKMLSEFISKKKKYVLFPSVLRDTLLQIMKPGLKSENDLEVPKFVSKNKEAILGWIEQTIADEGEVKYYKKKYRRSIVWRRSVDITDCFPRKTGEVSIRKLPEKLQKIAERKRCKLIEDEIKMLNKIGISSDLYNLGVYSTTKGKIRAKWQINITKRENLLELRKMIRIPHREKDKKFYEMMKEFVRYLEPINIEKAAQRIQKRNGFVTSRALKKEMGYTQIGTAYKWIKRLEKEGFLSCIKKSTYSENYREPAKYIIPHRLLAS